MKTKEERIGQLLYFSNRSKMFELSDTYRAKIKAYREELKQLLKEEDANKQHT